MRRFFQGCLILPLFLFGEHSAYAAELAPSCGAKFDLCGYVDRVTKREVIPARFERALPFSEGLAAVRIDGRFGYIDERGEIVVQPKFDLAGEFYQGLAEVLVGNQTGVINRAGEFVVPPMFRRAIPLTGDVVLATEGLWRSGYYEGYERLERLFLASVHLERVGLYHISGYWIRRPDLRAVVQFDSEGKGLVWATEEYRHDGPYGLLSIDGKWVVEPQYQFVSSLSDGLAVVRKKIDGQILSGAVNASGVVVIPIEHEWLAGWGWGTGLSRTRNKGKEGYVDKNGKLFGGRYFDKVGDLFGDVILALIDGRWVGVDREGNIVPDPRNGRINFSCPDGVRLIEMDGKLRVTNAKDEQAVSDLVDVPPTRPDCSQPFPVKLHDKYVFIKTDGSEFPDRPRFDTVHYFSGNHFAAVRQNGKWGLIDRFGKFIIAPKYDGYHGTNGSLLKFMLDKKPVWLTASGEEAPEPDIKPRGSAEALSCGHKVRIFERDGLWGIADVDGTEIVAPKYRAVACFKLGVAWVADDEKRQWCAVGPDGKMREKPDCRIEHYPYIQTHSYPEKLSDDRFENSVSWSRAFLEFHVGKRELPPQMIPDRSRPTFSIIR